MNTNYTITAEVGSEMPHVRVEFTFDGKRTYAFVAETERGYCHAFMWERMSKPVALRGLCTPCCRSVDSTARPRVTPS